MCVFQWMLPDSRTEVETKLFIERMTSQKKRGTNTHTRSYIEHGTQNEKRELPAMQYCLDYAMFYRAYAL